MDKTVKAIRPADLDVSQIQDNHNSLLQQILDFLNGNNAGQLQLVTATKPGPNNNPPKVIDKPALVIHGEPSRVGPSLVIGDAATAQKPALSADIRITGNIVHKTTAVNGYIINPFDTGPTFYVTNVAGNSALFIVYGDGTILCQGINSASGFKQTINMGSYWNTGTAGGQNFFTQTPIINVNGGQTGYITRKWTAPRPGSMTGVSVNMNNSVSGNLGWVIYKNGISQGQAIVNAGQVTGYNQFPKGQLPFTTGDVFTCQINLPAGINFAGQCDLEIETGA